MLLISSAMQAINLNFSVYFVSFPFKSRIFTSTYVFYEPAYLNIDEFIETMLASWCSFSVFLYTKMQKVIRSDNVTNFSTRQCRINIMAIPAFAGDLAVRRASSLQNEGRTKNSKYLFLLVNDKSIG